VDVFDGWGVGFVGNVYLMGVEGWFLHFEIPICDFGVGILLYVGWDVNIREFWRYIQLIWKSLAKSSVNLAIADALACQVNKCFTYNASHGRSREYAMN
jgi:hypothetical protein